MVIGIVEPTPQLPPVETVLGTLDDALRGGLPRSSPSWFRPKRPEKDTVLYRLDSVGQTVPETEPASEEFR